MLNFIYWLNRDNSLSSFLGFFEYILVRIAFILFYFCVVLCDSGDYVTFLSVLELCRAIVGKFYIDTLKYMGRPHHKLILSKLILRLWLVAKAQKLFLLRI